MAPADIPASVADNPVADNHLVAADIHRIAVRFAVVHSRPAVRIPPADLLVGRCKDRLAGVVTVAECSHHTGLADWGLAPG